MNTNRHQNCANPLHGNLLQLSERHQIAIYLRNGAAWVAEFNSGRVRLFIASAWYATSGGRTLAHAQRRGEVKIISPLPEEVTQRLECLHRHLAESTVAPAVWRALAGLLATFRRLGFQSHHQETATKRIGDALDPIM
jgi:hypothetical protein